MNVILNDLRQRFAGAFGKPAGSLRFIRSPGRVNLIGEHTDYNGGLVLPMAIEPAVWVAFSPRADSNIQVSSTAFANQPVEWSATGPIEPGEPKWANYVRGVASLLREDGVALRGMDVLIHNTLPVGSGLSSSAAIEVGFACAIMALAGAKREARTVALLCQLAEHRFAGVPCGIMDQSIVAGGKAGHAMLLDCRSLQQTHVPLNPAAARIVILNTMVRHELSGGEYAKRKQQCEEAVAIIRKTDPAVRSLRDVKPADLQTHQTHLPELIFRCARHVVTEIERTREAAADLMRGDIARFGQLMCASHESLRDDYEVSCPELDWLAAESMKITGVLGARMTGGGFGGCAVALVKPDAVDAYSDSIAQGYVATYSVRPEIIVTTATDGAGEVTLS